jgi:hypothetical protein
MLFFGLTGFVLNHEEWFTPESPKVVQTETVMDLKLIEKTDKLAIVEQLRDKNGVRGALAAFDDLADVLALRFESPGQTFNIEINKADGKTSINNEMRTLWVILGNLHRGHSTGTTWKWVLDITAILVVIACVTGAVLWVSLPKRRRNGILALLAGIAGTIVIYWLCTPGADIAIK